MIGPTTVAGTGVTTAVAETVEDNTGVNRDVLKFIANDAVHILEGANAISEYALIYVPIIVVVLGQEDPSD